MGGTTTGSRTPVTLQRTDRKDGRGRDTFRILLVEDNKGDALLIREALRDDPEGRYEIAHETTLGMALAKLDQEPFDAVLLDLGLPDSQGLASLTPVLSASQAPVLVLTGLDDQEFGLEAVHQGAQDYLVKGKTGDDALRRSLRYAIERARLRAATTSPLIETAPVGLAVLDRDLRYLYVNPAMAAINGVPALAHLGRSLDRVLPELGSELVELLRRAIDTGEPIRELEVSGRPANRGETATWLLSAEPLRDASGERVGLALSMVDITERKRKEQALADLAELRSQAQAIGESLAYGIWICDPDGGLRYASPSFLELIGMSLAEATGFGWTRALAEGTAEPMLQAWADHRASGTLWEYELVILDGDGRRHTVLSRGGPIRDERGGVRSWAGINLDITERKEADAFRDAYIGVLSHELRTPITSIYGASTLLRRSGIGSAQREELVGDIGEEADRLRRLVENLLILARAERRELSIETEPLALGHVVGRVVEQERRLWRGIEFDLDVEEPAPMAMGDETFVSQVLGNMLSNAAKYGGVDGHVQVIVDAARGKPRVRVLDSGPGIDPEEAEQLFGAFYRSMRTSKVSGSGIGLFVARHLIEAMRGRIWARPRPDVPGAEFGFELQPFSEEAG